MSWAQEFPPDAPVKLRIYLERWPTEDPNGLIRQALHNYFAHRATLTKLEFSRPMKQGRTSLYIGLEFLAACLVLIRTLPHGEAGTGHLRAARQSNESQAGSRCGGRCRFISMIGRHCAGKPESIRSSATCRWKSFSIRRVEHLRSRRWSGNTTCAQD